MKLKSFIILSLSLPSVFYSFTMNAQVLNNQRTTDTKNNQTTTTSTTSTVPPSTFVQPASSNNWRVPKVPQKVSFAGENVPLERFEVYERLDRELLVNSFYHTSTSYILKLMPRYFPTIERILKEEGVPEDFKFLCVAESSLQNLRSPAGAEGFWQFLSATAKGYGLEVNAFIDERYHLEKATRAACKYLKEAKSKFGTWTAAAASYNCGMGGYNGYASYQGSSNYYDLLLPEETNRYIFRIIALKLVLSNPKAYGFNLDSSDTYQPYKTRTVAVNTPITNLSSWAQSQGTSYKMVRLLNPWIRGKEIPNKSGKTYYIEIPAN